MNSVQLDYILELVDEVVLCETNLTVTHGCDSDYKEVLEAAAVARNKLENYLQDLIQ